MQLGTRHRVWLGAILLLGLSVRLWGIGFGLPNEHARPDERHLIGYTLALGGNGLNPGFFGYPSLYLYLLFAAYAGYLALGLVSGHFSSVQDLVREYALAPTPLYLIDRAFVALLGTATIAVVYWIGKRAAGRRVGLLAALFLSVAYLHVRDSHFGTVDVPVGFFATLAVALLLDAGDKQTLTSHALAGLVSGLAVSTKYTAMALVVPLALLNVLLLVDPARSGGRGHLARFPTVTAAALVFGFLLGTPFALLDSARFLGDAVPEILGKFSLRPRPDLGPGWLYHLRVTLPVGLGYPMLVLSAVGMFVALSRTRRRAILLLAFPVAWWVGVGMSHVAFLRYCVPIVPMLCLFAAWGVDGCLPAERGRGVLSTALVIVTIATPAYRVMQWDRLVRRTDTRVLTRDWIERNVPTGASIGLVGSGLVQPELWNSIPQLMRSAERGLDRGHGLRTELRIEHIRRTAVPAYETYTFDSGVWRDSLNPSLLASRPPTFVVQAEHPLFKSLGITVPTLGSDYVQRASFEAYVEPGGSALFDRWDAFLLPYARFEGVSRPGPNLRVFEHER